MDFNKNQLAILSLRIGIAFALLYAGISIFLNPLAWIGFVPGFVRNIAGNNALYAHAVFDIFLGLWLLSNQKTFYAASLTALNLFFITIFNFSAMEIVFRDVTVFFACIALALMTRDKK